MHLTGAGYIHKREDEAARTDPKVHAAGGDGDPHYVVRHGRGDPPLMVPRHSALLGILLLWPKSLHRDGMQCSRAWCGTTS